MNTIEIPFNKFIGIKKTDNQDQFLLELPASENLENHLGTIHASAQFALAEACSGEFLLNIFEKQANNIVPVPLWFAKLKQNLKILPMGN